jgi:hypothetical protein
VRGVLIHQPHTVPASTLPPGLRFAATNTYTDMGKDNVQDVASLENASNSQADAQVPVQQSADSTTTNASVEPRAESRYSVGDLRTESIATCIAVIPTAGSNAGKQMYVINGKHWSRHEPLPTHNTVVLEYVTWKDKRTGLDAFGWNVAGTNVDAFSLTIDQKIAKVVSHDASYSQAIALLLK